MALILCGATPKSAAEQVARKNAVRGDLGAVAEHVAGADGKPLEKCLRLVDLAAVQRHDHARRGPPARERDRNEEGPVGGVQDVVVLGVDGVAGQHDLCGQIACGVQSAWKAIHAERERAVRGVLGSRIVGREHGDARAERARG